jgi:hypothetical protein
MKGGTAGRKSKFIEKYTPMFKKKMELTGQS